MVEHKARPKLKNLSIMKTTIELPTSRSYLLLLSDSANAPDVKSLNEIIKDSYVKDYEYAHSILEKLDDILDLKVNESMYFLYCRDNNQTKSVIKRIQ